MINMLKRVIFPLVLVTILGSLTYQLNRRPHLWEFFSPEYWEQMSYVSSAMRLVHTHYVDAEEASYEKLSQAALSGLMGSLDGYSDYLSKKKYKYLGEMTHQEYVGIGIAIERVGSRVTIVTPFEGGPAQVAGILPGDRIVGVDGQNTEDFSTREVSRLLAGSQGASVNIRIYRPNEDRYVEFVLHRRSVSMISVRDVELDREGIAYLRINQFGMKTSDEFSRTLDRLESEGMKGLIIDLRNNPGGVLSAAISVAGEFFDQGEVVVYTEGRTTSSNRDYLSSTPARAGNYPVCILINQNSASGAEIVAGALRDKGRAITVGERSLGKGSVQKIFSLKNNEGIRQTTAFFFTVGGQCLDKVGVEPDIPVQMSHDEYNKLRLQRNHMPYLGDEGFRREFGFDPIVDRQREAAKATLKDILSSQEYRG